MGRAAREVILVLGIILVGFALVAALGIRVGQSGSGSGASSAVDPASGLPTIARSALPREAQATLDLIAAGGPFPYDQDGSTYQNRERLLPSRPAGTYREYTVETPGSPDRGARRIVTASTGEAYWTPDHYASFARILP